MTFPTIPTVAAGRVLTTNIDGTGTRTFPDLSGLTKNSGDLLIAIIVAYQDAGSSGAIFSSWGASFTEFNDQMTTAGSTMAFGCAYKWSTGSETGTFTVTQASATGGASLILLSIPGAHASTPPECGTIANGTSAAADPGSFNPAGWGAEDTLWISLVASGMTSGSGTWTATGTAAPTSYGNRVDTNRADDSTIGRVEGAVSFRQLNAASEDVGTAGVDTSNARNSACILAVRPVAAVSVALTGEAGTGAVGSFGATISVALNSTGASATGAVGTLAPTITVALNSTGASATGAVGSVGTAVSYSVALTGEAATGAVGSLVPSFSIALTGEAGTGAVGTVTAAVQYTVAITGETATGSVGDLSKLVSLVLTGETGTGTVGTLSPSASISINGNEVTGALGTLAVSISVAISNNVALGDVGTVVPSVGGGGGPVVTAYNRTSMAGGVTQHQGISKPSLIGQDAATKEYKQHDFKPDGVNRETYLIDGDLP